MPLAIHRAAIQTDLAGQLKERLGMDEVAQRYGFSPNRSGFIQCPFHKGDNHGSLKLYPGQKGWHCFGCQRGGSVIDFVMQLYGIDFRQACLRLNTDFGLRLTGQRPDQVAQAAAMEKRRMEPVRITCFFPDIKSEYSSSSSMRLMIS